MKRKELHFHFHNPNTDAETAEYILRVFAEVNRSTYEEIISKCLDREESAEKHST